MNHPTRFTGHHATMGFALAFFLLLANPTIAASQSERGFGPLTTQPFVHLTGDLLAYELVPSYNGIYKGVAFRTNRWGMRDKEYELKLPPRTYRVAMVGTSFTMGAGVPVELTIDGLLEDGLNRELLGQSGRSFEMLNFSVGGYGILQEVVLTQRKVFPFTPNALLLVIHSSEILRMTTFLSSVVRAHVAVEYPYVREKLEQAGVRSDMEAPELRRRLQPCAVDLVRWSYQRIADMCREHGVAIVGVLFPEPMARRERELARISGLASAAGIPLLSLDGAYGATPLDSVKLAGDLHLNALGHRLVADRLYRALRADDARALKLGFAVAK